MGKKSILLTFGIELFKLLIKVVIVRMHVIPTATLAAVASFGIQKLIQEIMTIKTHGA